MIEFFARLVLAAALFIVPMVLLIIASKKPDNALFLLFPILGIVPAGIAAAVLFVPIEYVLADRGLAQWTTPAVIAAGGSIVLLFVLSTALLSSSEHRGRMFRKVFTGDRALWSALQIWGILGAIWGGMWRASESPLSWVGLLHA